MDIKFKSMSNKQLNKDFPEKLSGKVINKDFTIKPKK